MLALLAALMIAFSIAPVSNNFRGRKNKDYDLWYRTGRIVLDGGDIYPKERRLFPFMYPPAAAAMLAVASAVGDHPFVVLLTATNSAAWLGEHPALGLPGDGQGLAAASAAVRWCRRSG